MGNDETPIYRTATYEHGGAVAHTGLTVNTVEVRVPSKDGQPSVVSACKGCGGRKRFLAILLQTGESYHLGRT